MNTTTLPSGAPTAPAHAPAGRRAGGLAAIRLIFLRELRPLIRDPFTVVFSMIQPLFFLALFAPLLKDVPGLASGALQWFVPGIIVMSCLMGASMTGSNLLAEMQTGSHERLLVAPLPRHSLVVGRALKEVAPMLVQAVIVVAVVVPFGFELHLRGTLIGLPILAAFSVGLGALSYALALAAKNRDWLFWTVQQTLLFPVLLLAGMLLPVDDGPGWLQTASRLNPLTYVVDAERALFNGHIASTPVAYGAIAALAVLVLGLLVGSRAMRRAN